MQRETNSGCTSVNTRKSRDSLPAHVVEQLLDRTEILDPERDGRVLEQAPGISLAGRKLPPRGLTLGHVLDGDQDPVPAAPRAPAARCP